MPALIACVGALVVALAPSLGARAPARARTALPRPLWLARPAASAPRAAARAAGGADDDDGFDVTRSQLDVLSGRSFRRDVLLQYENTNQSEPLRILLWALLALALALAPALADDVPTLLTGPLQAAAGRAACGAGALGSAALFARERGRRTAQLVRLEREYQLRDLPVRLDDGIVRRTVPIGGLRAERRGAVLLIGSAALVREAVDRARAYRTRLADAGVVLVAVPVGAAGGAQSGRADPAAGLLDGADWARGAPWLGIAAAPRQWRRFLRTLGGLAAGEAGAEPPGATAAAPAADAAADDADADAALRELGERGAWVALSRRGRSVGSAPGLRTLALDELLGSQYGPAEPLPPAEAWAQRTTPRGAPPADALERSLAEAQAQFYAALASADERALAALWAAESVRLAAGVDVPDGGGRLDGWDAVLADGATVGLRIGGTDAVVLERRQAAGAGARAAGAAAGGGNEPGAPAAAMLAEQGEGAAAMLIEGVTSCYEYPAKPAPGTAPAGAMTTLLATQRWVAEPPPARAAADAAAAAGSAAPASDSESEPPPAVRWRLVSHRTIPFTHGVSATACLRCDARGCMALGRQR